MHLKPLISTFDLVSLYQTLENCLQVDKRKQFNLFIRSLTKVCIIYYIKYILYLLS